VYVLNTDGTVTLTAAGAEIVNAGGDLPAIELTVTDAGGLTAAGSDTPEVNDLPTISVVAEDFNQTEAEAGDVAANYSTTDEEDGDDSSTVSWTSGAAPQVGGQDVYVLNTDGTVTLTAAGAEIVNAGGDLPAIELTVTDAGGLTAAGSDTPEVNDLPTITVTAYDFVQGSASVGALAGTWIATDEEDGTPTNVTFTSGANLDGYYVINNGQVLLTQKGADLVNSGGTLPLINLTVTDSGGLIATDTDLPDIQYLALYSAELKTNTTVTDQVLRLVVTDTVSGAVLYDAYITRSSQGSESNVVFDKPLLLDPSRTYSVNLSYVTDESGGTIVTAFSFLDANGTSVITLNAAGGSDNFKLDAHQGTDSSDDKLYDYVNYELSSDGQSWTSGGQVLGDYTDVSRSVGTTGNNGTLTTPILLSGGDDIYTADKGNDVVDGGEGDDRIYGDEGNDVLFGGAGNDVVSGGAGNDVVYGGAGNDVLLGGSGSDTFVFKFADADSSGTTVDRVLDFDKGVDSLRFEDVISVDVTYDETSGNSQVVALFSGGVQQTVVVEGVHLAEGPIEALNNNPILING
jgi:Ca2+-binding RTX toxin-like protein